MASSGPMHCYDTPHGTSAAAQLTAHLHGRGAVRDDAQHPAVRVGGDVEVAAGRGAHLSQEAHSSCLALILQEQEQE